MSKVLVQKADSGKAAVANPFFGKVEHALEAVRRRAYELFEQRGRGPGSDLDDWLRAESELFYVPDAEMTEDAKAFHVCIATPGFEAADVEVVALSRELLVEARNQSHEADASETKCLYRRFELAEPIDIDQIRASLDQGQLTIDAPKKTMQPVPVRAAAA
jgi:HSP20 family molecular chaperone IbpA